MICRFFSLKVRMLPLICAIGMVASVSLFAGEQDGRRSIQFTEPRRKVSTNVNELRDTANGLKNLEEDLSKPLRTFNFDDSFSGVSARPLPPPRVHSIRVRRPANDGQREWAFSTPEEIMGGRPGDDPFNLYDSADKETEGRSAVELYYDRMYGPRLGGTNRFGGFKSPKSVGEWNGWNRETNGVGGLSDDMDKTLRNLLDSGPAPGLTPVKRSSGFGDVFLFRFNADRDPTPESLQWQKEQDTRIENFKKIWQSPAPSAPPPQPLVIPGYTPGVPSWNSGPMYSSTPRGPSVASPGAFNSSVSGVPAGAPQPAPAQPAKTPPARPEFSIPRRPF